MRWVQFKGEIEEIRDRLEAATKDTEIWAGLTKELPNNEAGRRIAGSKPHVDQYRALLEDNRPAPTRVGVIRDALKIQADMAQKHLEQTENITVPSATMTQELERLKGEVEAIAKLYGLARRALETLVAATAAMPPGQRSLEQAVEDRAKEVASEYREKLAAARATAEADAQRKVREADAKAIQEKAEAEADRIARLGAAEAKEIREGTERKLADIRREKEREKQREEARKLQSLAEDPEVQRLYTALLAEGSLQFTGSPRGMCDRGSRPMPASFGDLNSHGWLRSPQSFARAMSHQPNTDYNVFNDRPTRAFPRTAAEWKEMDRLLAQFKILGPIWVKMNLLRP